MKNKIVSALALSTFIAVPAMAKKISVEKLSDRELCVEKLTLEQKIHQPANGFARAFGQGGMRERFAELSVEEVFRTNLRCPRLADV